MLDLPTLQRNSVSFCRSAVVQNRQEIFDFECTGHGTPTQSGGNVGCWGRSLADFRSPVDHPAGDSTIERGNRFALQRRSWSSVFNCYAPTVTRDPEPSFPRGSRCPEGATAPAFASAPSECCQ